MYLYYLVYLAGDVSHVRFGHGWQRRKRPSLKADTRALTQEEVLAEAKETEKLNLALLEETLKLEAKQKPVIRKQRVYASPPHHITLGHSATVPVTLLLLLLLLRAGSRDPPSRLCRRQRGICSASHK